MRARVFLIAIMCAQAWLWYSFSYDELDINGDNAHYLMLGHSIATGQGYRVIMDPGRPIEKQYPAGWPLMIAGLEKLFGSTLWAPKLLLLCLALATTWLLFQLFKWPVALATALTWHVAAWSSRCMSETPYMFWWVLAYYAISRGKDAKAWNWLAVPLSIMPLFTRAIGVTFGAYFLVVCVVQRRWWSMVSYLGLISVVYLSVAGGTTTYGDSFHIPRAIASCSLAPIFDDFLQNVEHAFLRGFTLMLLPLKFRHFPNVGAVFIVLITVGVGLTLWRGKLQERLLLVYLGLYMLAVMLWSPWVSLRYLAPVWPLLVVYALKPFERSKTATWCAVVLILTMQLFAVVMAPKAPTQHWQDFYACAKWCQDNTPEGAMIVSRKPSIVWWYSRRYSVRYPYTMDRKAVWGSVSKADYVIVDRMRCFRETARYLIPALAQNPSSIKIAHIEGSTVVVRVIDLAELPVSPAAK